LIAERYGVDPSDAFMEVNELDLPIVVESYYAQKVEALQQDLEKERKRTQTLEGQTKVTEREKQELAKLRFEKKEKRRKAKTTAAASG
jgi:hypothetical protein